MCRQGYFYFRKTFSHNLNKCYTDIESKLKIIFESSVEHVSANKKLGMTNDGALDRQHYLKATAPLFHVTYKSGTNPIDIC